MSDPRLQRLRDELAAASGHLEAAERVLEDVSEGSPPRDYAISATEAGRLLGVHRNTVALMVKRGELEAVSAGKVKRISKASVDALLRRR